jgi:hypothetical protein
VATWVDDEASPPSLRSTERAPRHLVSDTFGSLALGKPIAFKESFVEGRLSMDRLYVGLHAGEVLTVSSADASGSVSMLSNSTFPFCTWAQPLTWGALPDGRSGAAFRAPYTSVFRLEVVLRGPEAGEGHVQFDVRPGS